MSGWWFSASASSATRVTNAIASAKEPSSNVRSSAPSTSRHSPIQAIIAHADVRMPRQRTPTLGSLHSTNGRRAPHEHHAVPDRRRRYDRRRGRQGHPRAGRRRLDHPRRCGGRWPLLPAAAAGRPRTLAGAEGVLYYRTLAGYRTLRAETDEGSHVIVVGGGFIGYEVVASLTAAGRRER